MANAPRSVLKTEVRKVREAVAEADVEKAGTALREASRKLDKAAAHGVIHANAAARIKSRLSAAVKNAKGATPTKTVKKPKAKKS